MDFLRKAFQKMTGDGLGPVSSVEDQPKDEIDLAAYIKNKVQDVRQSGSRVSQEGIWMTNYAYMMGFDSVYYDTNTRQYRSSGVGNSNLRANRIHVNKILPVCQRRQAKICQNPPKWEIRPDSSTQEAKDQARFEKNLLEFYIDKERVLQKRQDMMIGMFMCGHYFIHVCWNDEKGELLARENKIEAKLGLEDGSEEIESAEFDLEYEGDVDVEIVNPLEVFADPLATTIEEAAWVVRCKVRKIDYFRTRYPERGALVKEEDAWLLSAQYEMRIQSLTGQGPSQTGIQTQMRHSAIEITYWERPSKKFPKGRQIISANGVLLEDKELPIGAIPLVKFDDVPITQKFYSEAIVTHLRPIQDQYNRLISKRAQWTNMLLAGKYIVARGAELQQEAMNNQSGEILYYTPVPNAPNAGAPTAMNIPMIPQYAYAEEDKLNGMFYDIAGEGEISRGILPAAGIPAIGMQLLLEQDQTRIATVTAQHEYAFAILGKFILLYLEKYVKNERLLKIADPNFQYVVESWSGAHLTSKHDVTVIRGSTAPVSLAAKRNELMNAWQVGLMGNPQDPQVLQKVVASMEFGDVSNIWEDQAIDMAQVKRTLKMIEDGKQPEVNELDNHPLHIQEKNRYRKSEKFDDLDPNVQALLLNDIEDHVQALMKLTAPQFGMSPNESTDLSLADDTLSQTAEEQLQAEAQNQALSVDQGL